MKHNVIFQETSPKLIKDILKVPDHGTSQKLSKTSVYSFILTLSFTKQNIIQSYYYQQLSIKDLAKELKTNPPAVRRQLAECLHEIRYACNPAYSVWVDRCRKIAVL